MQVQKDLKAIMVPLSSDGTIPSPQPLQPFWRRALDALESVDPRCKLGDLKTGQVHKIAPLLLGQKAWELLSPNDINNWDDFVAEVECWFGVNQYQQDRQFKSLVPGNNENGF